MAGARALVVGLLLVAGAGAVCCGGDEPRHAPGCVPGERQICPCLDGSDGVQDCAESGDRWEPCQCAGGPAGAAGSLDQPGAGLAAAAGDSPSGGHGGLPVGGAGSIIAGNGGVNAGGAGGTDGGTGGAILLVTGGTGTGGSTAATGGFATATGGSTTTGTGGLTRRTADTCEGYPADSNSAADPEVCVGVAYAVEPIPVDMFIMMDRTSSMYEMMDDGLTRWDAFTGALQAFVDDPTAVAGPVRVGLGFFSYSATLDEDIECDPNNYATPVVPIGDLEETGPRIMAEIEEISQLVGGWTPTYAALQGALQYAGEHQALVAGRITVVVFVTDGLPTQCPEQSMQSIAELAGQAFQEHGVLTFVIGLSPGLWNLNQIAQYGGSIEPIVVESGADAIQVLLDAMLGISTTPLGCELQIPAPADPSEKVDYDRVRLLYHPPTGETEEIPRLDTPSLCADSLYGGWYYDNEDNPSSIRVCDCNCVRFGAGLIEVVVGCEPLVFNSD